MAEHLLQHLFGLGTDMDRRHVHEHSKVLPRSMFDHHSLHLREQQPQSFRRRPMIVRVGHPDVCGQIGHHTLSDAMEDALGSNLCTHSRGDKSDSDSLFRWSLKLRFFRSHLSTTSRDCQSGSSKDMSRRSCTSLSSPSPICRAAKQSS